VNANEEYIVVFGGYSTDGELLGDVNFYHTKSQRWSGPIVRSTCCDVHGQVMNLLSENAYESGNTIQVRTT
jgi:Galactose oxidase, central domain